jgi:hypothetical protein
MIELRMNDGAGPTTLSLTKLPKQRVSRLPMAGDANCADHQPRDHHHRQRQLRQHASERIR